MKLNEKVYLDYSTCSTVLCLVCVAGLVGWVVCMGDAVGAWRVCMEDAIVAWRLSG